MHASHVKVQKYTLHAAHRVTHSTLHVYSTIQIAFLVGAIALAEFVAESKMLEQLDLRDNDIRIAGLMALSLAHKMNYKLVRLSMPRTIRLEPVSITRKPHM